MVTSATELPDSEHPRKQTSQSSGVQKNSPKSLTSCRFHRASHRASCLNKERAFTGQLKPLVPLSRLPLGFCPAKDQGKDLVFPPL